MQVSIFWQREKYNAWLMIVLMIVMFQWSFASSHFVLLQLHDENRETQTNTSVSLKSKDCYFKFFPFCVILNMCCKIKMRTLLRDRIVDWQRRLRRFPWAQRPPSFCMLGKWPLPRGASQTRPRKGSHIMIIMKIITFGDSDNLQLPHFVLMLLCDWSCS